MIQLLQQAPDHRAGLIDRDSVQIATGVQTFQEHGPPTGVCRQQPDGATATPVLQGQMLLLGPGVGPGHLQDSGGAVATSDRQHQRRSAVHRATLEGEFPLLQRLLDESR